MNYEPEEIKSVNVKSGLQVHLSDSATLFITDLIYESQSFIGCYRERAEVQ